MKAILTLFAVCLIGGCNLLSAQVEQIERRVYARLETMRNELLSACLNAKPEVLAAIAQDLLAGDTRSPHEVIATALQRLRGGEMESHSRFCAHLVPIVQPVVVDQGMYDGVHVTPYLSRKGVEPGAILFDCLVRDAQGEVVSTIQISEKTSVDDLLRFRATGKLALIDVPEGRYRVELRCSIDGDSTASSAYPFRYEIEVISKFKERADCFPFPANPRASDAWKRQAVVDAWYREHAAMLADPLRSALFFGVTYQVERVYRGEPRLPCSDPRKDLETAERVLVNLEKSMSRGGKKDADTKVGSAPVTSIAALLDGVSGRRVIGLPVGKGRGRGIQGTYALVSVDLTARDEERPLVLVVPGSPSWDHRVQRPTSPRFTEPNWMLDQLQRVGFDTKGSYHVAIMESPGRYRSAPVAVAAVCRELQKVLRVRPGAVVLIGEREGAYAVGRAVLADHDLAAACVLVCGGAMSRVELTALQRTHLLLVTGTGHVTTAVLKSMAASARAAGRSELVTLAPDVSRPYLFALPLAKSSIEAFVSSVTATQKTQKK